MSYTAQSQLAVLVNQYNTVIRALRLANQLKRKDIKSRVFRNLNHIRAAIKRIPVAVQVLPVERVVGVQADACVAVSLAVSAGTALAAPLCQ